MKNEQDAFTLGLTVSQLSLSGSTSTPGIDIQFFKNYTRAFATALGIDLDMDALIQSANPVRSADSENVLLPIFRSLEIAQSTLVAQCFKFGFLLTSYITLRGMYPLTEITQERANEFEQLLRKAAYDAEVGDSYLEDLISYCKSLKRYEQNDKHFDRIKQETILKIDSYLGERGVGRAPERTINNPFRVFCCYARRDQQWLHRMKKHLAVLEREGLITIRDDIDISPGEEWKSRLRQDLSTAHIILLLISPDFIASNYCYEQEMRQAIARHDEGTARVIPVIIRPTSWLGTPLNKLQALPKDAKAISMWPNKDEAFVNITDGIRTVVQKFADGFEQASEKLAKHPNISMHASNSPEADSFTLGAFTYLLGYPDLYKEKEYVQSLKVHAKAYATAFGVALDVEALVESANPDYWLGLIIPALERTQSRQIALCCKLGYLVAAYFILRGMYPISEHSSQDKANTFEQLLRGAASSAGVDERYLEDLINACKNQQIDEQREKRDAYIIKIGSETLGKIATYLETSRHVK